MSEMQKRRLTGGIPASALGQPDAPAARSTPMADRRVRIARGELRNLAPYGEVWIQILGSSAMEEIEAATWKHMETLGLPPSPIHLGTYNLHRFRRVLAAAVRDPKDHTQPFGTLEEWGEEPDDVLTSGIQLWKDVKARLDPTTNPELTDEEAESILEEFKKKDFKELRSFGAATLASWLLSGAVQLSSSPTASSRSSDSSQE